MTTNHTFGQAIEALTQGKMISRAGWNGKGMFVFRQVPSEVPAAIIPKMTSLPELVKEKLAERGVPLRYENQMALVNADSTINGWVASSSDTLASDWCIYDGTPPPAPTEPVVAGETVGTANPLPTFAPHQQRVVDELAELKTRLGLLCAFIEENPIFVTLDEDEQCRLMRQNELMGQLADVLNDRIDAFSKGN